MTAAGEVLTPDICVIGGGAGGLTVAAGAAAFGVPVVLVEANAMGGDCLNAGCVPSKALIAAARRAAQIADAPRFGIDAGPARIDFTGVMAHVAATIAAIAPHDSVERFEGLGVTVIRARARFVDADTVEAGGRRIRARRFVVATGSRPALPPIPGLADVAPLTNESLFRLEALPRRLAIIGGGPMGVEMAQAFRRLGTQVVVLEADRLLAREEPDLAAIARAALVAEGVELVEGCRIVAAGGAPGAIRLAVRPADTAGAMARDIVASHVLVAAGRRANTEDMGLAEAGIATTADGIAVDRRLASSNRRVLAIGDVADVAGVGVRRLTSVAGWHGGLALRSILFRLPVDAARAGPARAVFCDPELAQAGLTEAEARARLGDRVRVLTATFAANDRARAEGATAGVVKVTVDRRGRIVGAGLCGPQAGELVAAWAMAIERGLSIRHMAGLNLPYPTLAEVGKRAAIGYYAQGAASPLLRRVAGWLRRLG